MDVANHVGEVIVILDRHAFDVVEEKAAPAIIHLIK